MKPIRWSDNDRYFGPFTVAKNGGYKHTGVILGSGDGDEYAGCRLRISLFGWTVISALPPIVKPWRLWVDTSRYEWSGEEGGYWHTGGREYGFHLSEGHLSVSLGRSTDDSSTEQRWGCFLPWTEWRCTAHRFYGADGALEYVDTSSGPISLDAQREIWAARDEVSTVTFAFEDFDGERLTAKTRIEEREYKLGTGRFKWLSLFRRKVRRSLDIQFSGETGRRKGSWKGGTIGHSIDMLPGESHEAAFRRYCDRSDMTFSGASQEATQ